MAGNEQETYECDVLVVGSGCAGMSAAVTAGHHGLNVLIVEKESRFGGTTARSGGWLWIPGTSLAKAWGIEEAPSRQKPICATKPATVLTPRASMRFSPRDQKPSISSPAKPRCGSTCR